jgi:hypothetical protein
MLAGVPVRRPRPFELQRLRTLAWREKQRVLGSQKNACHFRRKVHDFLSYKLPLAFGASGAKS